MAESPKTMTVKVNLDSDALRFDIHQMLFLYSEWLDAEGLIRSPDETLDYDTRTLDALVIAFLDREK